MAKILIQYKNGEQIIGDPKAIISSYSLDQIEGTLELSEEEHKVLTNDSEKDTIGKKSNGTA